MRKPDQRQILSLLYTMKKAQSVGLYPDCRECAIAISKFIESIEGNGTKTAELLEEYCAVLSKADSGENNEIDKTALQQQLANIENSVRHELKPNRIEVAFLSHKAIMSNRIKSVYLKVKKAPNCDAFWIPVPYFAKNPDGSNGEMRYEGAECYSGNIECIDWKEYDTKARQPDVIVTFDPNESENSITSIHPDYECERLRNHTELLINLPCTKE